MNYDEMTNRQITWAAKKVNIVVNYTTSCGGGREDPNRDHQSWFIEIYTGWQTEDQQWHNHQANLTICSGRFDGKQACESEAKRIALIHFMEERDASK